MTKINQKTKQMKISILLLIAFISLLGFNSQKDKVPYSDYVPNGKGLVRFHFVNITDTSNYMCWYNTQLPSGQHVERFQIYSDSLIEFEINACKPTMNYLYENSPAQFMVLPNDTIDVIIDRKRDLPLSEIISFRGSTDKISDYLTKGKLLYYSEFLTKELSPEAYNLTIDTLTLEALTKLDAYKNKINLPEWFVAYEKMDIFFHSASLKNSQYSARYGLFQQYIENKTDLIKELTENQNKINWLTDNTFDYLEMIRPIKYDTLMQPQHYTTELLFQEIRDKINCIKGLLSDKIMSYFVASSLSHVVRKLNGCRLDIPDFNAYSKKVDSLFAEMTPLITDTVILKFINEYKVNQYKEYFNRKKLVKGDKAPGFYLEDINGAKVNLSNFKEKVICLNFWGTYCSPCIASIPQKNELVQKYGNKGFVLINICTDYNFELWKDIIARKKFEGIHLKCIGNWEKILKENYSIKGVPHYVIIDRKGNIIENDVQRDSLDYYIKSNI